VGPTEAPAPAGARGPQHYHEAVLSVESPAEPDIGDYARIVWRRKFVVVLSLVVVVGVAVGVSFLQTPRYSATAKVVLRLRTTTLFGANAVPVDAARAVQTEIEAIQSDPVKGRVRDKVGTAPKVRVSPVGTADLIAVRAESTSAVQAATVANAYADSYIEFRREQNLEELLANSRQIESKVREIQAQIDDLAARTEAFPPCVDARTNPLPCSQRDGAAQERNALVTQQISFRERLNQLQVEQSIAGGGAQIGSPASVPSEPFEPEMLKNALMAAVLGLLCGVALAFLFDYLDDSVKDKEDFERAVPRLAVIGLIPQVAEWKAKDQARLVSRVAPRSPPAEAYRILRTSIQFLSIDRPARVIQVTSASAQEGKTTTLANLAVAFASSGIRTVAVCCDLRRPRLHEFFDFDNTVGFTSVLLGTVPLNKALQPVPGQDGLLVLASGPLPPNPAELLTSTRSAELLRRLAANADVVLIDSPPVLPVTDALVISQHVDATLLVSAAGVTTRKAAARAVEMLERVNAPVVGAVLNGVSDEGGYGGYASRYYSSAAGPRLSNGAGGTNGNGPAPKASGGPEPGWGDARPPRRSAG
jgi:succinoglycan biosynthesis transport protein ExoP